MTQSTRPSAAALWASQNPRHIRRQQPTTGINAPVVVNEPDELPGFDALVQEALASVSQPAIEAESYEEVRRQMDLPEELSGRIEALLSETRRNERSRVAVEDIMQKAQAGNPEQVSFLKQEIVRLTDELKNYQKELYAMRKATAVYGRASGASFWRRLGQALERDCDGIEDVLDGHEKSMPAGLAQILKTHAANLSEFAQHAVMYGEALG